MMEFQFAHKKYIFPEEAVKCYPWFSSMFGLNGVFERKEKLHFNLLDFLKEVEMYKIREMIESLDYLQLYYCDKTKDIYFGDDKNTIKYLRQVESFLSNGPGATKGLDVPYQCTKCDKILWNIDTTENVYEHVLEYLSNTSKVCIRCGHIFSSIDIKTQNLKKNLCIGTTYLDEYCEHEWE